MIEEPGPIDGEIIEEMKNLELMISFHKKARSKNLEPQVFRPNQIKGLLDRNAIEGLWDLEDYDGVRLAYAEAWVLYYTSKFLEDVFYTDQQFADYFKVE